MADESTEGGHPFDLQREPGRVVREGGGYDLDLAKASVGAGWHPLLERIFAARPEGVEIVQVKEKFGGLRCYFHPGPHRIDLIGVGGVASLTMAERDESEPEPSEDLRAALGAFRALVDAAEAESFTICETCGAPGKLRGGRWMRTLCEPCERAGKP